MARLARIVIPNVPHHITQRGNRQLPIFFGADDRSAYLWLIAEACAAHGTVCLGWCLMDNHVHLILVPNSENGLRATLGEAHRRYSRQINLREGWRGYLFQGRFASYPMDNTHLMAAVRYVENYPVMEGSVARAENWLWSSARSHIAGKRVENDPLTDVQAIGQHVKNWRALLHLRPETMDPSASAEVIEARIRTGRPLASPEWISAAEAAIGRKLAPQKRGPKVKGESGDTT